tara:strand:+ start:432 stop:1901 length:1470 start_codon:yes stop_codon:yes gene_type:complete
MSSTYTTRLRLEKQGSGENASTWGTKLNDAVIDLVDSAVGAITSIDLSGVGTAFTVSTADGVLDQARSAVLYFHGSVSTAVSITVPAVEKVYILGNLTSGGHALMLKPAGGTQGTIPAGQSTLIYTDGTTVKNLFTSITGMSQVGASLGSFTSVVATDINANTVGVSVSLSATNIKGATGSFTTKVSAAALEISGVTSLGALRGTTATFSGAVSVSTIAGDGSSLTGLSAVPDNYLTGMILSNDSDSDHDISIKVGITKNSTNASDLELTSAIVKQIDATWANGSAAGGLASGVTLSANTWYHLHAIAVTAGTDAGFDTSSVAANLIANNDASAYRRIGSVFTDSSSNIIPFSQIGDEFLWNTNSSALVISKNNITVDTTFAVTIATPLSVTTWAMLNIDLNDIGNTDGILVHSPDVSIGIGVPSGADTAYPAQSFSGKINSGSYTGGTFYASRIRTDTQSRISYSVVGAGTDASFATLGWVDTRGKDG